MAVQFHATKKELQRTGAIRLTRLPLPEGLAASSVLFLVHSPQVNHIESSNPLERSSTHPKALLAAPLTHPSSKTFRGTHAPQDPGQAERAHQAHGVGAFQVQGLRRPIHHGLEETEDHLGSGHLRPGCRVRWRMVDSRLAADSGIFWARPPPELRCDSAVFPRPAKSQPHSSKLEGGTRQRTVGDTTCASPPGHHILNIQVSNDGEVEGVPHRIRTWRGK